MGQRIQQTQGLVLIPKANGDTMWVHPDLVEGDQWIMVTSKKKKRRRLIPPS